MPTRIHMTISDGVGPHDIVCQYTRGIMRDTVTLTNVSDQALHNVNLTLTLGTAQKQDRRTLWRSNAAMTYRFLLRATVQQVSLDLTCDEGSISHEYPV